MTKLTLCTLLAAAALAGCATTGAVEEKCPEQGMRIKYTPAAFTESGDLVAMYCAKTCTFSNGHSYAPPEKRWEFVSWLANALLDAQKKDVPRYEETGKRRIELYELNADEGDYTCAEARVPVRKIKGM